MEAKPHDERLDAESLGVFEYLWSLSPDGTLIYFDLLVAFQILLKQHGTLFVYPLLVLDQCAHLLKLLFELSWGIWHLFLHFLLALGVHILL